MKVHNGQVELYLLLLIIKIKSIKNKMLSRLVSNNKLPMMVNNASRAFRASAVADKKPSIGDAVTILQSKVSSINQVVSIQIRFLLRVR
jgi:hypothetical protein